MWEVKETFKIIYNGEPVAEKEEITADDVLEAAKKVGLKKFTVKDATTNAELSPADFPLKGHIVLIPYNEAA